MGELSSTMIARLGLALDTPRDDRPRNIEVDGVGRCYSPGMDAPRRNATYEDLLALPPHVTGQILFGVLHAFPRPAPKHARAALVLCMSLARHSTAGATVRAAGSFSTSPSCTCTRTVREPSLACLLTLRSNGSW